MDKFSRDWNNLFSRHRQNVPSAYTNRTKHQKKFGDKMVTPFSTDHYNKGQLPNWKTILGYDFEETDSFECSGNAESVQAVAYDEKHMLLLVTWVNSRTGVRGGLPVGNQTIYERVPEYIYRRLKSKNENTGHCGDLIWAILRTYGDNRTKGDFINL